MFGIFKRLLPLLLLFYPGVGAAQQVDRPLSLNLGDAIVTGFSGTLTPDPSQRRPANKSATDLTFINPDGASVRIFGVGQPGHVWDGRVFQAPKKFDVPAKEVGQVFGVALDDQPVPNVYVAATSVFGLHIVGRGRDGQPERRKKGAPGAGWMKGQFGLDLQGGPGAVYRIDGRTGAVSLFANVTLDGVPNPGPGLGNLAYDSTNKQLFVSDLHTGMIHRFDLDGRELGSFDHGVTGLGAAKLPAVLFNPRNRPNIANDRFDTERPETWGFALPARRVWGLAVHQGRLYYSVVAGPQIWSVGIQPDGGFAADPRWELDVPAQSGPLPVSDIAFSQKGAMILAQRALIAGAYDYSAFTRPGEPQVFRVWLKGPNDPPSPGRWKPVPEEYAVGFAGNHRNTNGGIALGYGYGQDGTLSTTACEFSLWTTAQNMRNAPALRDRLDPGGPQVVHGIQGIPASPVRDVNVPPWSSYSIDYDDKFDDPRAAGHLGSVRTYSKPCTAPAAYGGPGYPASPPYTSPPPVVVVDTGCIGRDCPPPPPRTDLEILKIGEHNPNNPKGGYNFTIAVRNLGAVLTGPQTITVTDVVPAGMTFTGVTSTNWTCTPIPGPPIPAGGPLTCTYSGAFPVATSQVLGTISIVATGGSGPHENCATLGAPNDGNSSNDKACVTVRTPPLDVKLEKTIKDRSGPHVWFNLQVTNVGPAFTTGAFTVTDTVPVGMTVMAAAGAWTCPGLPVTGLGTFTCTYNVGSIPLNHALPPITLTAMTIGNGPWENCALVAVATSSGTDNNPANDKGCVTVNPPNGQLIVEKRLLSQFPITQTYPVTVTCGSTVTNLNLLVGVPQTVSGIPYGTSCAVVEAPLTVPPNLCAEGSTGVWSTTYAPPSPITISAPSTTVTVSNRFTCTPVPTGSLVVTKQVENYPQGMPIPDFTGQITCGGANTNFTLANGASQTVGGLAIGTTCTVQETTSTPPSYACPQGQVGSWSTSYVPSNSVTIGSGPPATVTIVNRLECKPVVQGVGEIIVKKVVVNNAPNPIPSLTYPVTVTCGSTVANFNLLDGVTQASGGMSLNTPCTAVETLPPPPSVCPENSTPAWTTTYAPSATVTITNITASITLTNTLDCRTDSIGTGSLVVNKQVINNTNPQIPTTGMVYAISAICQSGSSPSTVTSMSLAHGGSQTVSGLALNTVCTITEVPPGLPPMGPVACTAPGHVPVWTIVLPPPVTITGPNIPATVQNILDCKPSGGGGTGELIVKKEVKNNVFGASLSGLTYPVTVTCGSNVTAFNLLDGVPQSTGNIPLSTSCAVQEAALTAPAGNCAIMGEVPTWSTVYAPSSSVTITGITTTVTVTNTLDCKPGGGGSQTGSLLVRKDVTNNTPSANLAGLTYPTAVSCASGMSPGVVTNLALTEGPPQPVNNIALGSVCTVTETLPPAPTAGCPVRFAPVWAAPVYAPPTTNVTGNGVIVVVRNTLNCEPTTPPQIVPATCDPRTTTKKGTDCVCRHPSMVKTSQSACACTEGMNFVAGRGCVRPIECRAPMIANPARTACVCSPGLIKRGNACVRPIECRAPAKANRAGNACTCPRNMDLKGNTCVEKESRGPTVKPSDVIRVLPGLLGGGGGGGGGRSGGGGAAPDGPRGR